MAARYGLRRHALRGHHRRGPAVAAPAVSDFDGALSRGIPAASAEAAILRAARQRRGRAHPVDRPAAWAVALRSGYRNQGVASRSATCLASRVRRASRVTYSIAIANSSAARPLMKSHVSTLPGSKELRPRTAPTRISTIATIWLWRTIRAAVHRGSAAIARPVIPVRAKQEPTTRAVRGVSRQGQI